MQKTNFLEELTLLKAILDKTPLEVAIKWGGEVYTHKGKNVVSYGGFKNHFCLWFYNGVFLQDPYRVLVNANEEKTKALRQWRFTSMDEIEENKILEYIREAIENEEKGLAWKPQKTAMPEIPSILQEEFQNNPSFRDAFYGLTTYKQKEYIEHIASAKQDKTKVSRLQKCISQVLKGVGLHDKYK
jgi:uncharacterized protein YdeI (YjbR/CyaY-like superfamily)